MHSQFQSLLLALEQLNESTQNQSILPLDIAAITQTSATLHQLITKWNELKPEMQNTTSEPEFQVMVKQIDILIETIKTASTNAIEELRERMRKERDKERENDPVYQERQKAIIKERNEHLVVGTTFHSTGKKLSEAQFNASQKNILCLHDICGETEIPTFAMHISTEQYCDETETWQYGKEVLSVNYSLDINVNEESGEDGAPAPCINSIPIHHHFNHSHYPTLNELSGLTINDDDCCGWDAWLGNDAPSIDDNELQLGSWRNNQLFVLWTGRYGWDEPKAKFRFKGYAFCEGISISVKQDGEEEELFLALWDQKERDRFTKIDRGWKDYGAGMPEDRRKWKCFTFKLK